MVWYLEEPPPGDRDDPPAAARADVSAAVVAFSAAGGVDPLDAADGPLEVIRGKAVRRLLGRGGGGCGGTAASTRLEASEAGHCVGGRGHGFGIKHWKWKNPAR